MQIKSSLLLATASFALALGTQAHAQDAANSEPQNAEDTGGVQDIIVTATRRGENLQDVPISVSAFSASDLAATGTSNAQDLAAVTPGLTMANQSAGITPFIRGVGAVDNTVGQEAAVATYVDGVYISSVYGSLFTFNNIERVEVLKGPQGTLFGRNATGGLIHVITKDPSQSTSMQGAVSYGNFETVGAKAYVTGGITDTIAADLAVVYKYQGEGWGRNVNLGRDVGFGGNDFAIRSKVLFSPSEATTIKLSGDYSQSKGSDIGSMKDVLQGAVSNLDNLGPTAGFYNNRAGYDEYVNTKQWGGSLNIKQDFGGISLVSTTAYRDTKVVQAFDNDATPVRAIDVLIDNQYAKTFSQEVQLLSDSASTIQWIVGAFYMDDESGFADPVGLGLYGTDVGGTGVLIKNVIKTKSISAFGEVTFPLGEKTQIIVGGRYTKDKRSVSGRTEIVTSNVIPGEATPSGVVFLTLPATPASFSKGQPTWRAILNHKFNEDIMAYASYSRGFKSGNFNTTAAGDVPFGPEKLDAFEVGLKSDCLDGRLRFNAAAFYYKYDGLQLNKLSGSTLLTTNAASATIKGIDFDGELALIDALRIRFGGALLDAKFDDFTGAQFSVRNPNGTTTLLQGGDLSGNRLTRSPKATFNIGAFVNIPTNFGSIDANVNYVHNSGYFWEPDNRLKQDAYGLLNAQLGWKDPDSNLGLKLFAKNLTKTEYDVWQVATGNGDLHAPASPRTYGAELSFSF